MDAWPVIIYWRLLRLSYIVFQILYNYLLMFVHIIIMLIIIKLINYFFSELKLFILK